MDAPAIALVGHPRILKPCSENRHWTSARQLLKELDIPHALFPWRVVAIEDVPKSELLRRIVQIETNLRQRVSRIEEKLAASHDVVSLFTDGLTAYRRNLLKDGLVRKRARLIEQFFERIRSDSRLRLPHKKILIFLLGEYNFSQEAFREVHFSRLVKECRIGKNKAKGYLELLEASGYISRRDDGYRKWFGIRSSTGQTSLHS